MNENMKIENLYASIESIQTHFTEDIINYFLSNNIPESDILYMTISDDLLLFAQCSNNRSGKTLFIWIENKTNNIKTEKVFTNITKKTNKEKISEIIKTCFLTGAKKALNKSAEAA